MNSASSGRSCWRNSAEKPDRGAGQALRLPQFLAVRYHAACQTIMPISISV